MTVSMTRATDRELLRDPVTDTYDYDAFGNKINSTGTTSNNMLYRGEELDPDLGLYYLRARYYNPLTGRFMSRDPKDGDVKNPATLHKYLYAAGTRLTGDPSGRGFVSYALEIGESIETITALRRTGFAVCVAIYTELLYSDPNDVPPDWATIIRLWCAPALNW